MLEVPAYNHWFGLQLHDLLLSVQNNLEIAKNANAEDLTINFRVADFSLSLAKLNKASQMIQHAASMNNIQSNPCTHRLLSYEALRRTELATA